MEASSPDAYRLLHDGIQAFSKMEEVGIKIDTDYLTQTIEDTTQQIKDLQTSLRKSEIGRTWRRAYGEDMNLGSGAQLGKVLFEIMKYDPPELTASGQYKTGAEDIGKLDIPFTRDYIKLEQLKKTRNTFLRGIQRELDGNGYVHVFFNLHTVSTYRSSSSEFNFQNLPIRDKELGAIVRRAFIPREKDRRLVEIDYGGIEVGIAACYHQDPKMISYIKDPSKDMHRDMAAKCFQLRKDQVSKLIRYSGKNMFVFPQFYGDYFGNNARDMWEFMTRMDLELVDGTLLKDHLAGKGIHSRQDFEPHVKKVEKWFWSKMFPVYAQWKDDWHASYLKNGYIITKTGFRIAGQFGRNDIINYPVQGSAFHCLLQSLVWIQKELRKRKMRTLLIGQIHDSILADSPDDEVDDYIGLANEVMTQRLPKAWPWIIVPLTVEAEVTPLGGTWHDKMEWEM